MIVHPKIRGFICTTAHPVGCARHVQEQIDEVQKRGPLASGPKHVLVIGASTGFGLSSRITAAFGSGAATIGVAYEKPAEGKRTATAGWYNTAAFQTKAQERGLYARSFIGDAFSDEMKKDVIDAIKKDWPGVDLLIYSLAAPRRRDPKTGQIYKSVLKPIRAPYTNKTIDFDTHTVEELTLPAATEEEIRQTVAVMGGEDWRLWVEALRGAGVLAPGFTTVAFSYVGPDVTQPVYRHGTIGAAKDHLEATALSLNETLHGLCGGRAFVSVNKALVTQSSAAIPFIPLYFVILMKVMKEKGVHEDCIHQMIRLFYERLYTGTDVPVDEKGRIRLDEFEMRSDVQEEVARRWAQVTTENLPELADLEGYHRDFLKLFGFGFPDVDYDADVAIDIPLEPQRQPQGR